MKKMSLFMTLPLLALAPVAGAQTTAPAAQPGATTTAPGAPASEAPATTSPTPADPAAAAPAPATATPTAQAAPTNSASTVQAAVDAGFPKYDVDKDGKLSAAEFTAWVSALKTDELKASGKAASPTEVSSYATSALSSADANKDGTVTREELTGFLGG